MTDTARRSFLTGIGAAATAAGLTIVAEAQAPAPRAARFQPSRHADDDWMDKLPGKHRMVIDAASPDGAGSALLFAANLYDANKAAYGLGDHDLAILIVMRHFATPFAYSDAAWKKYGNALSAVLKFTDPKTKGAPTSNLYNVEGYGLSLPNLGNTIPAVLKHGAQIAICDTATHGVAGLVAGAAKSDPQTVYNDFKANTIAQSRFVPAGVVAVNRAQERGYTLIYAG